MGRKIKKILKAWKKESGTDRVIQFRYRGGILKIYTSQPGWLIGRSGVLHDKYEQLLKGEIYDFKAIEFIETDYYWA
ncbi:hypothetical protein AALB39_04230 [Lachnospiraceae bacterium 54-53]